MASDPILADGPGRLRVRRWPPTPAVPAIRLLRTAQLLRESRSPCQEPFPFSPRLMILSILPTGHHPVFQHWCVRTSMKYYLHFILPMGRSRGFARWTAKSCMGAGGVTAHNHQIVKVRSTTASTAVATTPRRRPCGTTSRGWLPGWTRFHTAPPAPTLQVPGVTGEVDRKDQTPGSLRSSPRPGSTPGGRTSAALSGFHAIAGGGST
jgi:hypothetical protein